MSRKSQLSKYKNFDAVSLGADATSAVTGIEYLDNIGVQLNFTGTPTGTFYVEVSMNYERDALGNVTNPGNWVAIDLDPVPVAAGAAGDIYIDMTQLSAPWIRVRYARSSGTGTLNGWICGKQV